MKEKQNIILVRFLLSFGLLYLIFVFSCSQKNEEMFNGVFSKKGTIATITTSSVSNISDSSVVAGGTLTSTGDSYVSAIGVCWNPTKNPTIDLSTKTNDGNSTGTFTSSITGLTAGTTYFLRAYATNSLGTSYGNEVIFTTTSSDSTITDIDGNVYNTVTIGTQVWMASNLNTTRYNDGRPISNVTLNSTWGSISIYDNNSVNSAIYGRLYNWFVVDNNNATKVVNNGGRNVCPVGWHVPSDAEWTTLENYLIANGYNYDGTTIGKKFAKSLAAPTGWDSSTTTGAIGNSDFPANRNITGFTALPGGYIYADGTYGFKGNYGYWWSTTEKNVLDVWYRYMYSNSYFFNTNSTYRSSGLSVRCLREN